MKLKEISNRALLLLISLVSVTTPVFAQSAADSSNRADFSTAAESTTAAESSTAASGDYGNGTSFTGEGSQGTGGTFSYPTYNQTAVFLPTYSGRLTPQIGISGANGLPPCQLDSFVRSAGSMADLIYGDEGTDGLPPYCNFTNIHRIDAGIFGDTRTGLTTGHRSTLPSAWGSDEFHGAEWTSQPNPGGK